MSKEYKSRKKRISRRELIEKKKELDRELVYAKHRADAAEGKIDEVNERIRQIGIRCVDMYQGGGPINCIEIEPKAYGNYMVMDTAGLPDARITELVNYAEKELAMKIADALIEQNVVQFIVHRRGNGVVFGSDPFATDTIGAKLYVIPWEKMATWRDSIRIGNIRRYQNGYGL